MSSEYENIDKSQIEGLVDKYRKVLKNQDQDKFNEEDVKAKFINPLLEALGWDVRGLDQVKFEQTTLTGRTDFGLRLNEGEDPVLFVEAKSFSESLDGYRVKRGEKITYPQQAIDDAWSMKVDWAILTNFKKLRLYYSHVKKPEDGLQFELKFKDFLSDKGLEKLNSLSKETVEAGSLERYEARRTREDVNTEFVNDLYTLRKDLAGAISEKNDLSADEIRESVQRILDRLVVIRVAEDREIIHRESLHKMVEAWKTTSIDPSVRTLMKDLKNLFRDFDSVYNSELFDEHTCEDLNIENDTIKETIDTLYNYNFDLIDADVLGSMYEDYIGHILEEKEEGVDIKEDYQTRKKTGIYYTPTFVVDFLVDHTLGRLIRDSSGPEEVSKINVLDPACGSGSFLIKAFDYFKDYYEGYNRKIQSKAEKSGKLTDYDMITNINKKILDQNLYGVDLDEQAAEIASVNLMLKGMQKSERLPLILGKNIKVGNSLISELINEIEEFFDNPENRKPMLWEEEFSDVFQDGGFDVVIGNPPYFTIRKSGTRGEATFYYEYLKNSTKWRNLFRSDSDIYYYFIIQSLWLLKDGGHFGFIIENYWLENDWADKLRKYILEHSKVRMIVHFGSIKIFPEAGNDTCLLILQKETNEKSKKNHKVKVVRAKKVKRDNRELLDYISNHIQEQRYSDEFIDVFWVNQSSLSPNKWVLSKEEELLDRLKIGRKNVVTLGDTEVDGKRVKGICNIGKGQESHKNEVFVVDKESIETKNLEKNLLKPVVKSGDISRYSIKFQDRYLILTLNETAPP
ncbi:hypothetical protein AKJ48_03720 [candidate division MSBL1 archaeon SCGC-AAA261O19]|uniref:site-specific DNA-methyltransferase (adenine-specific) n=1 Tax=candidate division MSBL1 archaeon SCGC-AAA261O19 TaxID=1698277 RepID=A0A133VB38_9EURY|nr:hypothetical protein AKJ48_03720 [candidate division MSBL1 archaeon SCGC-AAA261O19]